MYSTATVHAYDVLDQVVAVATVLQYDGLDPLKASEFRFSATVPGSGESEPREYLRDVLVALLEAL